MANRIFDLQETKGTYQVKGKINGVEKDRFYTSKKTKTNKDFRAINFGCDYNDKTSIYMSLNGMPQDNVYFSKRNQETGKTETKKVEPKKAKAEKKKTEPEKTKNTNKSKETKNGTKK